MITHYIQFHASLISFNKEPLPCHSFFLKFLVFHNRHFWRVQVFCKMPPDLDLSGCVSMVRFRLKMLSRARPRWYVVYSSLRHTWRHIPQKTGPCPDSIDCSAAPNHRSPRLPHAQIPASRENRQSGTIRHLGKPPETASRLLAGSEQTWRVTNSKWSEWVKVPGGLSPLRKTELTGNWWVRRSRRFALLQERGSR